MNHVGLYFGTFNPIHIGHVVIANHILENTKLDEIWFVITPHNPHKEKTNLLNQYHRLEMVRLAVEDYDHLKACDVEFKLPQPNYTSNTLSYISDEFCEKEFFIIMGEDNFRTFHKWKNYQTIMEYYHIYVYPRRNKGDVVPVPKNHKNITRVDAPMIDISSSYVRNQISKGLNPKPTLPEQVWTYIDGMNFYKNYKKL